MQKLILPKYKKACPDIIRNEFDAILNLMSKAENNDRCFLYIYCLLKAIFDLLKRYETSAKETIFIAELEKDESEMRKKIVKLQKQTLHDELAVLGLSLENIDV